MLHFALTLLLLVAAADPGAVEVTRLDGTRVTGQITAWDASGIAIAAADGLQKVSVKELLQIQAAEAPSATTAGNTFVELVDGTRFSIHSITASGGLAKVVMTSSPEQMSIPTAIVRRVEFRASTDALKAVWDRVDSREAAGDAIIIMKGASDSYDYLTGVVERLTDEQVAFEWDGQKVPIKRSKVAGIAFYRRAESGTANSSCVLTMSDGTIAPAQQIELKGSTLKITTPSNLRLQFTLASLVSADFSSGKLAYLSDLKPESSNWTPRVAIPRAATIVSEFGAPRTNAAFSGSALTLAWPDESLATGREIRTYAKGLAVRSRSQLIYRLPAGMRRFTAVAGIDPATTEQGHVVLEIRADDRLIWEGEVDGKQPPTQIDVELKSARRLQIVVDYGRNLDYGDRLHLVEARVSK